MPDIPDEKICYRAGSIVVMDPDRRTDHGGARPSVKARRYARRRVPKLIRQGLGAGFRHMGARLQVLLLGLVEVDELVDRPARIGSFPKVINSDTDSHYGSQGRAHNGDPPVHGHETSALS